MTPLLLAGGLAAVLVVIDLFTWGVSALLRLFGSIT